MKMVYKSGEWKEVFVDFCASTLETVDDNDYQVCYEDLSKSEAAKGLLPHQIVSASFLASRRGCILADDMGLGKTRSALAALKYNATKGYCPAFIITPAGLRTSWLQEAGRYWPEAKVVLADGDKDLLGDFDIAVISYTKLKNFIGSTALSRVGTIIVDEAHSFKNSRALYGEQKQAYVDRLAEGKDPGVHRTALLLDVCSKVQSVYCLTGTPILSRPRELFNLLKMTRHPLGRNFIHYSTRYCGGHQGRFGWVSDGCTNPSELRENLKNFVLRRHKKKVLELPQKTIKKIETPLDMEGEVKYSSAWDDYIAIVESTRTKEETEKVWQAKHLVQISLLRQICSLYKVKSAAERISRHDGKVVVFSNYTATLEELQKELQGKGFNSLIYDGSLNEKKRAEYVERFQNDAEVKAFIAQIESAKVGLTLTAGTLVLFMDLVYTPADHFQAEDRCYRIGQTKEVQIEYLLCPGTVEDHLVELHDSKKDVISKIFDEDLEDVGDVISSDIKKELVGRLIKQARRKKPKAFQSDLF